jgi:hypothetical protein
VTDYSKGTFTTMFIAALFTIAKLWKQPRCPTTDEWYAQWNFTQPQRMKFCHLQVNAKLNEVSLAQKAKNHMFSLICRL